MISRWKHSCQMAIAWFLDRMCLALRASGQWLRYAWLQNLIPSFPWIAPPRPPGAIQGEEGIKFCHLGTLGENCSMIWLLKFNCLNAVSASFFRFRIALCQFVTHSAPLSRPQKCDPNFVLTSFVFSHFSLSLSLKCEIQTRGRAMTMSLQWMKRSNVTVSPSS